MAIDGPRPPEGDWLGTPYLRFDRLGPFARVTVDRPEARNALSPAMYWGIRYAIQRVERDPDLAGLLLTGTGDVFVPGGDLGREGPDGWTDFSQFLMDATPFDTLRQAVKPVVCAVNGICQGGGLQIALCSDLAVVSERATFRVPELFRGIADTYYSQMLVRTVGPVRTRDLMFTGRVLTAAEALDWGLVSRVVAHEDLLDAATAELTTICRTAPGARNDIKRSLDAQIGLYDRIAMRTSMAGEESREGWRAFSERRSPEWVPAELRTNGRL
ncbi:MAG: enoyl-CoA hydratase/isomerase family protein [Frankiales bacterium]|nr:enoyl-CoA hydratase/isomerase family protein [Frankiales bacterium]